ncbi:RHS repeat-associated core domain-containing protein [Pseudomonas sichuanensis]|uniref:RHS repeat-associated core domain-containing protein n=1 Tax=Pseudomonas sichuanensis TaxID=2213015 RepID=UPI0032636B0D
MSAHAKPVVLLATDTNGSPLAQHASTQFRAFAYTAYGYDSPDTNVPRLLGFNAQLRALPGIYLLGDGYRCFNTMLMRFTSPDSLSPFEAGGFNAYLYCAGDPVNHTDPSGHVLTTRSGFTIGQRPIPAKPQWITPIPPSDSAARTAMLTKQRESQLVTRTGLSNFSSYLKKLNVSENLPYRAPLNARVEQLTQAIKQTDDRLLIIQASSATPGADASTFGVKNLHQLNTEPESVAQNATIQQQPQARMAEVQQQNADVRQGSKD